jgi:type I restriction enzyme S subunit
MVLTLSSQPKILTDAWEKRKLGDLAKISAGGDVDKELLTPDGYPVIGNALTNLGIQGYYADKYRITAPAVTVTGRGEVGHAEPRFENFTPVVRVLAVESAADPRFLAANINNHPLFVESTGVPQLTAPQLSKYKLWFPSMLEEEKIGDLLKKIDDTIALHHQRHFDFRLQVHENS